MANNFLIVIILSLFIFPGTFVFGDVNVECEKDSRLNKLAKTVVNVESESQKESIPKNRSNCGPNRRLSDKKEGIFVQYRIHKKDDLKDISKDIIVDVAEDSRWLNVQDGVLNFCDTQGCDQPGSILSPAQDPTKLYQGFYNKEEKSEEEEFDPFGGFTVKAEAQREGHDVRNNFLIPPEDQRIDENADPNDYEGIGEVVHIFEKEGVIYREITIFNMNAVKMGISNKDGKKLVTIKPQRAPTTIGELNKNGKLTGRKRAKIKIFEGGEEVEKTIGSGVFHLTTETFRDQSLNKLTGGNKGPLIKERYTEKLVDSKDGGCKVEIVKGQSDFDHPPKKSKE